MNIQQFFRPYHFPSDGLLSGHGLTPQGFAEYLTYLEEQEPNIYKNAVAHINSNPECTPRFDKAFLASFGNSLTGQTGKRRGMHFIYRGNHTVSLLKEGDNFLLLDSYNAYPALDADHLPLLEYIRQKFPQSNIYTLHDKIQSDYHNCSFFATQSAGAIERALQNQDVSLLEFIKSIDTQKVHSPTLNCPNDTLKMQEYERLGIKTIPVPPQLVPFVQSLSLVDKIIQGSRAFTEQCAWLPYGSYQGELSNFSADERRNGEKKLTRMNVNIAVKNDLFRFACLDKINEGGI